MKILVAGDGKVGETLAKELADEGHDLILIDLDAAALEATAGKYDVMTLQGNCASMETLRDAGIGTADLLIASTGSDELNLLTCLTAHSMNGKLHTIARIHNPEYMGQVYEMRDRFGLSMTFNPEKQTAVEIDRLLKFPGFLKRDTFAHGRLEIVELRIDGQSKLCDQPLSNLPGLINCRALICAVLRGGVTYTPNSGHFTLKEGDRIFVTASSDDLSTLLRNLGIVTHKVKRVMLVGGGTVSYYLAETLLARRVSVSIVERDPEQARYLSEVLPGADVILGDASRQTLLDSEGIADSDAVVSLTGLDELNVLVSLYANRRGIPQTVTKLGRMEDTSMIENLPVGSIVSPRKLSVNNIVRYVRAMQEQTGAAVAIHHIADGQAEAIEFHLDGSAANTGVPLKNLQLKQNVLIAGILRGSEVIIPGGNTTFRAGDTVVIVVSGDTVLLRFNDIFE